MSKATCGLFLVSCLFTAGSATGVTIFSEGPGMELSDDLSAPTLLNLQLGANTIEGQVGGTGSGATNGSDADYVTFKLPSGQAIDLISVTRPGNTSLSFVGYRAASLFLGQTNGDLDSFALFSNGETLLPGELSSTPLSSGDHAFWIQETAGLTSYSLTFNVVPEPSSILLGFLGCGFVLRRRR